MTRQALHRSLFRNSHLVWMLLWTLGLAVVALGSSAQAQDWPYYKLETKEYNPHSLVRGPGGYFSLWKLGAVLAIYFLWIKTTDWVNRDCQKLKLPYSVWNSVVFWPFLVGLFLVFTIPIFIGGFAALLLCYLVPLGFYIVKRNSVVDPHERVLTIAHLRYLMSRKAKEVGINVAAEGKARHEKGAPVTLTSLAKSDKDRQKHQISARQSEGYIAAKSLLADMIDQRADKALLDYGRDQVDIKFQIDGVWHESEAQDRESGDAILAVFKRLTGLNVEDRRSRQFGHFQAEYRKKTYRCSILSQGTKTGERVVLQIAEPDVSFQSLEEAGMRPKMIEQLTEQLASENGFILFSAPPGNGLSTTFGLALRLTDRYMRDFVALEPEDSTEPLAENIDIVHWKKDEPPEKPLLSLIRKEPSAIVMSELPNAQVVQMLSEQAVEDKLVISTIRAKEAVEALLRVLLMKVPPAVFAPAVKAVVCQRLIRKLCEECKEEFEPSPALLKKLGIPAGRIDKLYKTPDPAERDKVCPKCNGIGYFGRTAIFELLLVDDALRNALIQQPKLEVLRKIARQSGNRNLQQEGIVLVAKGITSVNELSRVLKQ